MLISRRWQLSARRAVLALLVSLALVTPARGIYLDKDQDISLRGRAYTQATIRTEDSRRTEDSVTQTRPRTGAGDVIQNRFFYNPELEAKLVKYTKSWNSDPLLSWIAPDALDFRLAAWGFWDGFLHYGASQFEEAMLAPRVVFKGDPKPVITAINGRAISVATGTCNSPRCVVGTLYSRGSHLPSTVEIQQRLKRESLEQILEPVDPREAFENQYRINELYLSYTKGPFFLRLGKQTISWGESDTVALLDQNNPFDVTYAIPGIFEELDEARIPLWTVRSTLQLFNRLGPLSSGFIEAYWVPGDIDTEVAETPIPLGVSPYSPGGADPHLSLLAGLAGPLREPIGDATDIVLFDHLPKKRFENSRYGVRLQSVVGREHTVSAWYYTAFNNAPVTRLITGNTPIAQDPNSGISGLRFLAMTETTRAITHVFGLADTFFLEPVDTIVRLEAEYFLGEPAFMFDKPGLPAGLTPNIPSSGKPGRVNRANHLRFEVGFDRFFFMRFLNPTNSFVLITAVVGDWNLDETANKDFGLAPGLNTRAFDNAFVQNALQTDYLHGKLKPQLVTIANWDGSFVIQATADYRFTDWLLGRIQYTAVDGHYHQIGVNRDRDQLAFRLTYQLN